MGFGIRGALTLITVCAAQFMIALDFSIVTVALPAIDRSLNFGGPGALQWVVTAFILPTAGLLLLFGRLSDLFGRRRLFIVGMVIVTVFSLVAGLASVPWVLIAARAGQGVGSAMVGATALALLTSLFPEGPRRDKALGVSGALLSFGFVAGTIGGGVVTSGLSWRWTMLILVIMGAVVLLGAVTLLPRHEERRSARLDVPGALLATSGLLALVYGISTVGTTGWTDPLALSLLLAAVLLLGAFRYVEGRTKAPLAPLSILRRRSVTWGGLTGFVTFGMCGGTTVLLSLYMQDVLLWSPLATGAGFLAEGVAAIVAGALAARFIAAIGTPRTLVIGLLVQGIGTAAMLLLPQEGNLTLLLLTTSALGFGHVLAVVSFIGTMTSGVSNADQGLAGGLAQTAQHVGSAVGVAVLAAVVASATITEGVTAEAGSLVGLRAGLLVGALVTFAGAAVAALFLRKPEPRAREEHRNQPRDDNSSEAVAAT
ncbi:MFS transporter [Actinoalloteichus fjordicus]|uniref:Arabinose efflux permease family protein n=1 Tax=Actinoalloteichus fjordicus TaxID=1612552 RepID=A0AAC9LD33_9PSEU|nr:MFS transporter [Actinoalloteichus fjordicus]APU15406.1 arabinose efflux permease family protein [Actinoalloteichus fjordicus]